jgi:two-component system, cell cycle sensor histidine kinase and response regulator CckA
MITSVPPSALPTPMPHSGAETAGARAAPRVLVVDDDASHRLVARYALERDGHTVAEAADGREALTLCAQRMPDVVLLDAVMPVLDGFDACTRLRRLPGGDLVAVLIITALTDAQAVDRAFAAGATDFITKPIHWGVLRRRVHHLVQSARTQARLDDAEARTRALVDSSPDAILTCDEQGYVLTCNPAAARIFGRRAAELIGLPLEKLFVRFGESNVLRNTMEREITGSRPDGSTFPAQVSVSAFTGHERRYFSVVVSDATERKRAEESLVRAEANYRSIFENSIEGIFQTAPDGRMLSANPMLARIFGFPSPEALLANLINFENHFYVEPGRRAEFVRYLRAHGSVTHFESQVRRSDGQLVWISENARAIQDAAGNLVRYEGAVEDITERKRLEEQLRHAQKMEATGRLAGGIAHDFNNLLTAILGYTHIVHTGLPDGDPGRAPLDEIRKAAERAASLTRQLLAFSRRQVMQPKILDLNTVVGDFQSFLLRLIGEDIKLITIPGKDLGRVRADRGQVEQVLMNLAINSRDAMPEGGALTIETANVDVAATDAQSVPCLRPGPYVTLAVSDTGGGMDRETQARVFEPFFTTKEIGKGTGLGLATVYGIVKQSDGGITLRSEPGRGTTFTIYFPRVAEAPVAAEAPAGRPPDATAGRERVLVVEDEASVRALVCAVLRHKGYTVWEASNGPEALALLGQKPEGVDLLVTDMVMPHMSGRQLADRLTGRFPNLRVLYISGYVQSEADQPSFLSGRRAFLQKPFQPDELAAMVRAVLDSPAR